MIWRKNNNDNAASEIPSLSPKEALVLQMLINSGRELFGLEMVESSNGELKRGTIYVTLQRMEEEGFIESKQEPRAAPEIGIARRLYSPTGLGQRVLAAYEAVHSILAAEFAGRPIA